MNTYTATWFELFMSTLNPQQTEQEADFLARQFPQPEFHRVLDVCCGTGRHALELAQRGYEVVGVDRDASALEQANSRAEAHCHFLLGDMRDLQGIPSVFDAAVILWQSFGYFDDATNIAVLREIYTKLRPGGRLVLDVYHREAFERHQGRRSFARGGAQITEDKRMDGQRLHVELDYGGKAKDVFDWRLYTPDELDAEAEAEAAGFTSLLACTGFDETQSASPEAPRMQLVYARG